MCKSVHLFVPVYVSLCVSITREQLDLGSRNFNKIKGLKISDEFDLESLRPRLKIFQSEPNCSFNFNRQKETISL